MEEPLALSAFLERLTGLGDMEASIAAKTAEMQVATQHCEALAAESERCGYYTVSFPMGCAMPPHMSSLFTGNVSKAFECNALHASRRATHGQMRYASVVLYASDAISNVQCILHAGCTRDARSWPRMWSAGKPSAARWCPSRRANASSWSVRRPRWMPT